MPVSLLAAICTSVVAPAGSAGSQWTSLQSASGLRQALCSPGNTSAGRSPRAGRRPRISRCRASVALAQKTSSAGAAPRAAAMPRRASSSRCRARWPSRWVLVGLPQAPAMAVRTASTTWGSGGVVALASK